MSQSSLLNISPRLKSQQVVISLDYQVVHRQKMVVNMIQTMIREALISDLMLECCSEVIIYWTLDCASDWLSYGLR